MTDLLAELTNFRSNIRKQVERGPQSSSFIGQQSFIG
jgi:hypothetical protein